MKLYYFAGACSLASNIALREAGVKFELVKVNRHTHKAADGQDYYEINPKGYVPALMLDDGDVLTENVAVLQYIADRNPAAKLAPPFGTMERYHLVEWLAFINSEVHKGFSPLFREDAPEDTKQYARQNLGKRLEYLSGVIAGRSYLTGEQFTIADAYLFTVLSWGSYLKFDIGAQLQRYVENIGKRPHVVEALKAEGLIK